MNLNQYLDVAPEVAEALASNKPVVALESTIISHGMPYPKNVETALKVEKIIRDAGCVPATIAIFKIVLVDPKNFGISSSSSFALIPHLL